MLKSKTRAFTIIEVLCSISIFSLLFLFLVSLELNRLKIIRCNENLRGYIYIIEILKNRILVNESFSTINSLDKDTVYYIENEEMKGEIIKGINLNNLSKTPSIKKEYISITISEGSVLKVELKLHYLSFGKDNIIQCSFYKGNYL
ncbi:MAG TPA: prepilin-type N-terminal cleavage/methylation domain-containing protein [Clostridiaceae bacterium]